VVATALSIVQLGSKFPILLTEWYKLYPIGFGDVCATVVLGQHQHGQHPHSCFISSTAGCQPLRVFWLVPNSCRLTTHFPLLRGSPEVEFIAASIEQHCTLEERQVVG
jgi:hypothetical protein